MAGCLNRGPDAVPGVLASYSLTFSRIAIGLVFAASSFGKVRNFPAFERAVEDFHILL